MVDPKVGGKRWQTLHRLIYFSAAAGVIHYIWLVKADLKKPLEYAFVLGMLLMYRIVAWLAEACPARLSAKSKCFRKLLSQSKKGAVARGTIVGRALRSLCD